MIEIRQYTIKLNTEGMQEVAMPQLAVITGIVDGFKGTCIMWAQTESEAKDNGKRKFQVAETGKPVPDSFRLVGNVTSLYLGKTFHVFEVVNG